jgi:hypothetical protein
MNQRIILKWFLTWGMIFVDWIPVAQCAMYEYCRALAAVVMYLDVLLRAANSLASWTTAFQAAKGNAGDLYIFM